MEVKSSCYQEKVSIKNSNRLLSVLFLDCHE